jgi:hypothetical protein
MSRTSLKVAAVVLTVAIIALTVAALDTLPTAVRAQIASERTALSSAQSQIANAETDVRQRTQSDAALFQALPSARSYPQRLQQAQLSLATARRDMDELNQLDKHSRRKDRDQAERLLSEERTARAQAVSQAIGVQMDVTHWIDLKSHVPQVLTAMEADYNGIHSFDLSPAAAAVQRAETDWPDKKADLEGRLATERELSAYAGRVWTESADVRRQAAAGGSDVDYGKLFAAADVLHTTASDLPQKAGELKALSDQLYRSWDRVLVDLNTRGPSGAREYQEKLRTITVVHPAGTTTSDEKWVDVSPAQYDSVRNNLGMAIEHKPAGKYDVEADRVAQPVGFAYMAPPGQSNQYGHWENRDGRSFWVFYGQYALMRDLLFNHSYRAPEPYDWDGYRTSQRSGQTYYGRDTDSGTPKYGTQSSTTQKSYSGSSYAKSGGFRESQYASKSGNYRDSQYATPAARNPGGDNSPRTFGKGSSRREEPHAAPYRPAPRPAPSRPPSRSPGRTFGRRR